ncbi:hypothetical protein VTI74DRAFT_3109 [Chaetomium olivicolor]
MAARYEYNRATIQVREVPSQETPGGASIKLNQRSLWLCHKNSILGGGLRQVRTVVSRLGRFLTVDQVRVAGTGQQGNFPANAVDVCFRCTGSRWLMESLAIAAYPLAGGDYCRLGLLEAKPKTRHDKIMHFPARQADIAEDWSRCDQRSVDDGKT